MMKNLRKHLLTMVFAAFALALLLPVTTRADDSGTCGPNAKWTYVTSTNTLTISGSGAIKDYDEGMTPWEEYEYYKVVIKEGITRVGNEAFACTLVTSVSLPNSLKTIGSGAFMATHITKITIPKGVKKIEDRAFAYNDMLKSFSVSSKNKYYSAKSGVLFNKKKTALIQYPSGKTSKTYTIPSSVRYINESSFGASEAFGGGPRYLKKVYIPKNIKQIKRQAFEWYTESIYFKGNPPKFAENAMFGADCKAYYKKSYKKKWANKKKNYGEDATITWKMY